jgi:hypothetical protein
MLKVNYPQTAKDVRTFHQRYLSCFNNMPQMQIKFDSVLSKIGFVGKKKFKIENILTGSIDQIYKLSTEINQLKPSLTQITCLKKIFNYDKVKYGKKFQPIIAKFFMNSPEINTVTCFFCNIDHIYSFNLMDDFKNGLDLVKRGTIDDLVRIKKVGKAEAAKIINAQKPITSLASLHLNAQIRRNIENLDVKEKNNLFTLDHVLDKATHPVAALSLYNFVPCCYGCNSKFKRSEKLILKDTSISPTSKKFSFGKSVRFKILFPGEFGKTFKDIKKVSDFVLNFEIDRDNGDYENYLKIFRLRARYIFHKREVLNLISLRKAYGDSQLQEISKITKRTTLEIKKDVFGAELFENSSESKPLTKLRRDIAIDIGIGGVIT